MSALGLVVVMALLFVLSAFEQGMLGFMTLEQRLEYFGAGGLAAVVALAYVLATLERRRARR